MNEITLPVLGLETGVNAFREASPYTQCDSIPCILKNSRQLRPMIFSEQVFIECYFTVTDFTYISNVNKAINLKKYTK